MGLKIFGPANFGRSLCRCLRPAEVDLVRVCLDAGQGIDRHCHADSSRPTTLRLVHVLPHFGRRLCAASVEWFALRGGGSEFLTHGVKGSNDASRYRHPSLLGVNHWKGDGKRFEGP